LFGIHDRVSWTDTEWLYGYNCGGRVVKKAELPKIDMATSETVILTGTIVAEEPYDYYRVRRDDNGKCEVLCYRKLRLIDE